MAMRMGDRYMILVYLSILTAVLFSEVSCDVGTGCNSTDITSCDGTQGTGYQCDASNTCQCTTEYYDSSNICTAKAGFTGTCTSTPGCLGNMTCSSTDGTCGCADDHYHDNNNCLIKPGYNEQCVDTTKPCKDGLGLICTDVSGTKQCTCDTTHYYDGAKCETRPVYDGVCDDTTKLCQDGVGLICTDDGTSSNTKKCTCKTTHYVDGTQCSIKAGFTGTCTSTPGCLGNMTCSSTDMITDGTCGCADDHYHDNNNCLIKPRFSEACTSTPGCLGNLTCSSVTGGNCGCDDTYYHDGNNMCLLKPGFNGICNSNTGCLGNLNCSSDNNGNCGCDDTYYHGGNNNCLQKQGINGSCTGTTGCLGNLTCSSVTGTDGTCGCADTHYHDDNNCILKPRFNEACTSTTGCLGNLICPSDNNGNCGCDDTHYHDGNNMCLQKPGFNEACNSTTGCLGNLKCLPDNNGKCGCDDTHYHDGNNNCVEKPGFNTACTSNTGCLGNMNCSSVTNGNCGCDDTHYHDGNNNCVEKPGFNTPCNSTTGCLGNLKCSSDNGKCGCDDTHYHDGNNNCLQKPGFDTACTSNTGCLGNLICLTNGKCGCDDTYYHDGNNNCLQKKVHGEICTTPDSCNLENGGCYTVNSQTCLCNDNYYKENNIVCKPVTDLKPTDVMTESLASSSVTIKWTVPTAVAILSFNIKGTGSNIEKTGIDKAKRMETITGLTPKTQYTNVIVETVVTTDRNPSLVVTSNPPISFTTPKAGYKKTCVLPSTNQCSDPNSECVDLGSVPKCYCKVGFYTNNNQCLNASSLKTTIANVTPETDTVTVTWILPSNSEVITSFSIEVNDTINKDNIGNTATSIEITNLLPGTGYSIKVISIVNTDRNPTFEVKSDPISTITKQESGANCNPSDTQPCTGNLTCINNVCGCQIYHYLFDNNCYPKLDYDEDCSNSDQACITDFVCYKEISPSRCKCKPGEYRSGNQCRPVSELKPTSFRVEDSTASSLNFSWNVLHDTYIYEYIISGDSFQDTTILNSARNGTVTGLSSGADYTNIKITAKVITGRGTEVVDVVSDQIPVDSTNPGEPGALNSNNDYNTSKIMNIGFGRPDGGVNSYSVEITGPGLDTPFQQEPTTNSSTVPANTLQPGKTYTIIIIAVYKGNNSLPLTDTFLTLSTGSDPVGNLTTANITSRNLTVSWSYPDKDMGDLTSYILDVINNGNECVQQYIYQYVTDTNTPTSTNCVGVTPIYITKDLKAGVIQEITDLLPYINYTLTVTPYNAAGRGSQASKSVLTGIEAAEDPSNLNVTEIEATSFLVTWNKTDLKTGPTTYYLTIYEQSDLTNNLATQFTQKYAVPGFDKVDYRVIDVVSYWYYRVELQASTSVGKSSIKNITEFQTLSSAPGKVDSLKVSPISGIFTTAEVSWGCIKERDRHGIIMNYTLTSTLENEGPKDISHNDDCKFTETVRVKPGENIQFVVYATNMDFIGDKNRIDYIAPTGKPILGKEENILVLDSVVIEQTSFSVTVCPSCLKDDSNGFIEITALLVCVKDKCDIKDNQLTVDGINGFNTWQTAQANSFNSPYRVTKDTWYGSEAGDKLTFVVGSESDCKKKAETYFCNGPLNMDTEYQILAVSCTKGGCSVTQPLGSFKTKPEDTDIVTPVVVSIVVILVVVAVILGAVYFYKRRKNQEHVDEHSIHSIDSIMAKPSIPRYRPIKLEHFEEQIASLQKDSNLLFSEEFEGIGELSPKHESSAAVKEENKPKNRYVNILAFDHSRVKLLPIDDDETTDYINANYIPGYKSQREYIATQGPLITNVGGVDISTISDFWRMIWEQRVAIIVMLSDLTEKGKPKVDKYWKDQGESEQYGEIIVEVTSVSVLNKYTIKIFELKLGEEVRKVRHFFLPGWEDYRANLQPEDVLEFLSVVRQEVKPIDKGPMVVHCSAGVGRTGTFIALDIFQQYINERDMSSDIDIYDLVLRMRNFRQNMVQSEKQYIFIHETIKEIISQRKKRLADNDNAIYENTGYSNEAFVPDDIYQNVENGKPTTTL